MSAWMNRARSLRSNHSSSRTGTGRRDSEDEYVRLDVTRDPNDVATEILSNVIRRQGISEAKKFGYLNVCANFFTKEALAGLSYTIDEILCCLRVTLVHETTRIRATGIRTFRRLLKDEQDVAALIRLRIPYLVARILDSESDVERVQALRLCRRIIMCGPNLFPKELARSLVSFANGGAEEKEKILRVCLATLAELCVMSPETFILCGGVASMSRNMIESHSPRVIEALVGSLLFLLVHPKSRKAANIDLTVLSAPYCDIHYQHHGWTTAEKNKEERDSRISSVHTALLSVLRSFPGVLHFCNPMEVSSGLKSLVDVLRLQHLEARKSVMDFFNDILGVPDISWTDEVGVALQDVDPSKMQDSWKLAEGFVAQEGKSILPHLSLFRPNLVEVHKALLLQTFIEANILEALIEVIVTSDSFISLRAAILLGQILQMSRGLLPTGSALPSLPTLMAYASGSNCPSSQQRALSALNTISRLNALFKLRPTPSSLFLQQVLYFSGSLKTELVAGHTVPKSTVLQMVSKDIEDSIKKSAVLANKDPFFWNWNIVLTILKSRSESLKKLEDSNQKLFIKRLVEFFKPSNNRFSQIKLGHSHSHLYTLVASELIEYLVEADEGEASKLLAELIGDISGHIQSILQAESAHECLFSPHNVTHSMCQIYFLLIGRLCHFSKGVKVLENANVFQSLLDLVVDTKHDCYVKLVVSSLDYSTDGVTRIILSKVLKSPVEGSRLYATKFLLVLIRAHTPDFANWGMELLVMQLYDSSIQVSLVASDILDEACDHQPYLESLVALRPTLLQLGDRGRLMIIRFLSTLPGFSYLNDANFVNNELQLWKNSFNEKYARIVDAALHDAMTMHQKNEEGSYAGRLSNAKNEVKDFYISPHLFGHLAQHKGGLELLAQEIPLLRKYFEIIETKMITSDEDVASLKTAIWALAHISSSTGGLTLLESLNEPTTLADSLVSLATECPHYGVRASAFYSCSLLATTDLGASQLETAGWICVRQARNEKFPVIQVPDLSPVPEDAKFETDDTGIWFEFPDNRRKRSTSHCSSNASAGPVITFDDEVDSAINPILAQNASSSTNASPARINGVNTAIPPLLSLGSQRSQTLPHSKPPIYQKHHKRSLSDAKDYMSITLESPKYRDSGRVRPDRSPRVRSVSVNSGSVPPDIAEDIGQSNADDASNNSLDKNEEILSSSWQDIKNFAALRLLPNRMGDFDNKNEDSKFPGKMLKPYGSDDTEMTLRRAPSSLNSICRHPKLFNIQISSEPCYKGIALPANVCDMFRQDEPIYVMRQERRRLDRESICELDEVPEAEKSYDGRDSPGSDSERSFDGTILHDPTKCITCSYRTHNPRTPVRTGKISNSSRHTRTDTDSSEDFRIESFTLNSATMETATLNSNFSISNFELDMSQVKGEESAVLSKCTIKKEILKHIERLSNPIWFKSSKQTLLQLKQRFPPIFHDTCLYSDICNLLENSSYRLSARRSVQELFFDCHFDELYDEPSNILKSHDPTLATSNLVFSPPSVLVEETVATIQEES